ncbi:MAG: NTP transferase domain-containing protein [Planctomycetota bacterium]|nr:NTP transferase domain-containing protein [Planctomycetota bacterium]
MKALLLAAGEGRRLDPFTQVRPKPVLPLANRPLIRYLIDFVRQAGITDIAVVVGFKGEMVRQALATEKDICFFAQENPDGPFGAVAAAREFITETTLLLCADSFFHPDVIQEVITRSKGVVASVAAGVTKFPLYGWRAEADDSGRLVGATQVRGDKQFRCENVLAGLAVIEPIVADAAIEAPEKEWGPFLSALAQREEVRLISSGWELADMDYPWQMHTANRQAIEWQFTRRGPFISEKAVIHPGAVLEGQNVIADDVVIETGCLIRNSWIGAGTNILAGSYVHNGFIGRNCHLGPGCFVNGGTADDDSIIGFNTSYKALGLGRVGFSHECHIVGVWDHGSGSSANCCSTSSRHDGQTVKVKIDGELVESGLISVAPMIGYGASLAPGVNLMPGRKIGPYSVAGPDLIVYHDIPAETHIIVRQQAESRKRQART